ncbi:hypothetical protein CSUI_010285 [Cystoisospora suis]|uniref:Uncharacterized protein n=1 Tax=Cystoisospora suis TaxID=483139 RepID=A0A2C6KFK3_9APIC|nr:hypothetical protein CSUI_010285 [Cystoisospora suis]
MLLGSSMDTYLPLDRGLLFCRDSPARRHASPGPKVPQVCPTTQGTSEVAYAHASFIGAIPALGSAGPRRRRPTGHQRSEFSRMLVSFGSFVEFVGSGTFLCRASLCWPAKLNGFERRRRRG